MSKSSGHMNFGGAEAGTRTFPTFSSAEAAQTFPEEGPTFPSAEAGTLMTPDLRGVPGDLRGRGLEEGTQTFPAEAARAETERTFCFGKRMTMTPGMPGDLRGRGVENFPSPGRSEDLEGEDLEDLDMMSQSNNKRNYE